MGVVFSNGEDFANVRIYSGSAPANIYRTPIGFIHSLFIFI